MRGRKAALSGSASRRGGQRGDATSFGPLPFGVEALEAADVEEEVERPEVGGQVCHVPDDVGDALCFTAPGRLDRGRDVVNADRLPASAGQFRGELAAAAAEVEGTPERRGAVGLLPVQ